MESTNSNYVSSYDSKAARLGQGVDIKFPKDLVRLLNVSRLQFSFTLTLTRVQGSK